MGIIMGKICEFIFFGLIVFFFLGSYIFGVRCYRIDLMLIEYVDNERRYMRM